MENDVMDEIKALIEKKDAEIERLQIRIKTLVGMLADCASDKALITELCDALEFWPYWDREDYEYCRPLIERAREATR